MAAAYSSRLVVLSLALGAIATWGIAAAAVFFGPPATAVKASNYQDASADVSWIMTDWWLWTQIDVDLSSGEPPERSWGSIPMLGPPRHAAFCGGPLRQVPTWTASSGILARSDQLHQIESETGWWWSETGGGFPFRCCSLIFWPDALHRISSEPYSYAITWSDEFDPYTSRIHRRIGLPTHIHWPSFLANTVFWGAVVWVLIQIGLVARRVSRRRRCLCIRCRYPLRDLPRCPECGWHVQGG